MLNGLTITYVVVTSKIPGNANNEPPNVEHEGGRGEERGFSLTKQSHLSRACVRIAFSSNVMEEEEKGKKRKKEKIVATIPRVTIACIVKAASPRRFLMNNGYTAISKCNEKCAN